MHYEPEQYSQYYIKLYAVQNATYEGYLKKIQILDSSYMLPDYSKEVQSSLQEHMTEYLKKEMDKKLEPLLDPESLYRGLTGDY